jgi:hypothetical protein
VSSEPSNRSEEQSNKVGHLDLARAGIVVLLFVVAVVALVSWSSVKKGSPGAAPVTTTTHPVTTTLPPTTIARAGIKVQVANASSAAGAATRITQTLQTQGWNTLPPVNATSQSPSSFVYYAANRKAFALEIAHELGLATTTVQPLTTSVPVPGAAGDDVVVLVGPDLAKG